VRAGRPRRGAPADRHLRDYTSAIEGINQIVGDVVAWDLRKDGHMVDDSAVEAATEKINEIWRQTDPSIR
jgi:hypothetical protein